jgi:hypothetical protein
MGEEEEKTPWWYAVIRENRTKNRDDDQVAVAVSLGCEFGL